MAVDVGSAIAYLDLDTSGFTNGISGAASALKDFVTSSDSISTKVTNLGSSMSAMGASLSKSVTLPIVGLGTAATKTAADFEAAMSKVEAISGATGDEMSQLRDKAIEMGAKTKFSAKESADAFTYMAMAGWDAGQMIDGISGIMSLAAADGLDLATTSDIVTDALTAFGLQASDSSHFADVLAQASSSANTNVSMLGESFKYIAPVAGALGMSVEDVSLALGLMANSGIKGTQAGTSLRASLTNLVKPTDAMATKMEQLGIEVTNSDGSMKSLREIMDILREKFNGLSEAEQASAAATLFGKEAMSAMLAIINTSQADYDKLAESIANADGRADSMAETMMGNLSGSIEQMKGAIESLMIKLGEALIPTINQITQLITKIVEKLNTMSDEQVQQIVKIGAIVAAIGPLLMIVGKVITIIGSVIHYGGLIVSGIQTLVSFITGVLIPAIGAISAPVLAVIAAIAALIAIGVALYKNWDEICDWADRTWSAIKEAVGNAVDGMLEFFDNFKESVGNVIESVTTAVSNLWSSIGEFFSNLFSSLSGWFKNVTSSIGGFFSNLASTVGGAISNIWGTIVEWGSSMVSKAAEIGSGFVENFMGFFSNFVSGVTNAISGVIEAITSWGSNLLTRASEIGSKFYDAFIGGIQNVAEFFTNMFENVLKTITSFGSKMFKLGKDLMMSFWNGIKEVFSSIWKWVQDKFQPIIDMVEKIFSPIKSFMGSAFSFISGSHRNGLDYVPYDGYVAELHKGERVLTAEENQDYPDKPRSGSGGDTFIFNSPEAIDEYQAARLLKQTKKELDMDI